MRIFKVIRSVVEPKSYVGPPSVRVRPIDVFGPSLYLNQSADLAIFQILCVEVYQVSRNGLVPVFCDGHRSIKIICVSHADISGEAFFYS